MLLTMNKNRGGNGHQYGRRIEANRSWTVYHVFTGVPADSNAGATMGLNRAEAMDRMMTLNRCDDEGESGGAAPEPAASFGSAAAIA